MKSPHYNPNPGRRTRGGGDTGWGEEPGGRRRAPGSVPGLRGRRPLCFLKIEEDGTKLTLALIRPTPILRGETLGSPLLFSGTGAPVVLMIY